ncbi:MAG: NTP transferase domain-containing protein [Longicatena sp.]
MNAIILAAGVGHRFGNLIMDNHKALFKVGGIPIIERTIIYLNEAGIDDITIVVGHKYKLFKPLIAKYKVVLIQNKNYSIYNNLYSLELAFPKLSDTYVIHGDVVLFKNIFKEEVSDSFFSVVLKNPKGVPVLHPLCNKSRMIKDVIVTTGDEFMTTLLGVSYWNANDAEILKKYYYDTITIKMKKKYQGEWEHEILNLRDTFRIEAHQVDHKYAQEVNHLMDLLDVNVTYEKHWKMKEERARCN